MIDETSFSIFLVCGVTFGWILGFGLGTSVNKVQQYDFVDTVKVLSMCEAPDKIVINDGKLGVKCVNGVEFRGMLESE